MNNTMNDDDDNKNDDQNQGDVQVDDNAVSYINTSGVLPADFEKQAEEDDKRHDLADDNDESGEQDPLGEDESNEPLDIDAARKELDLSTDDDNGPKPINTAQDLENDEKKEWES